MAENIIGKHASQIAFPDTAILSPDCKDFIRRCLAPDPERRECSRELAKHPFLTT
jgi:hypothetical protein